MKPLFVLTFSLVVIHFPGPEGHSSLIYTKQLDGEKAGIAAPTRSTHLMHSFTGHVNTKDMEGFLLPSFTKAFTTQLRSYWLGRLDHPLNFVQLNKQLQLREVQTSGLTVFRSTQYSLKTEFQQVTDKIQQNETQLLIKPYCQMHEIIRLVLDLCLPSLFFPLDKLPGSQRPVLFR